MPQELGRLQLPAAALDALIAQALARPSLTTISRPDADVQPVLDATGQPIICAEGWETSVELTSEIDGQPVTWIERRIVVRSPAWQASQRHALERRLTEAEAEVADLLVSRRGKARPTTPDEVTAAVARILERQDVAGLLDVTGAGRGAHPPHPGLSRAAGTRRDDLHAESDHGPGGRGHRGGGGPAGLAGYATNQPTDVNSLTQVVLAYRDQYLVEHPIGRLKGAPLSLSPVSLSRDEHVTGLVRLLTIAVRLLSLLEYGIRQSLAQEPQAEPLKGLYVGQPSRRTRRPTAECVLEAFDNLTLTAVTLPNGYPPSDPAVEPPAATAGTGRAGSHLLFASG